MCNLRIIFCLFVSFYTVLAENLTSISDSLAVETTIHTIKSPALLPPETKSKTEKRDSSDEIGPTTFQLKEDESFRPITSKPYQILQPRPQQLPPSQLPSTFQPTTVRYIAEEAAPQAYYDRPPNSNPVSITTTAGHAYRGPFKEPYQLHLEQSHPQTLQQQSQYQLPPRYNQQQYVQPAKHLPNYSTQPPNADIIPLEGPLQLRQHAPDHQRHIYTQQRQANQNEQQRQPNQQPLIQKQLEQKPSYAAFERPTHPQYQQPARQNHYIIAIPLSYVRQLQYQSAAEHGLAPAPAQQQVAIPLPLPTSQVSLPPLLVLQPTRVGSAGSPLNREHFPTQTPTQYAPHAPPQSDPEAGAQAAVPSALALQQLPFAMSLILKEIARSRPAAYPAPQLLYVQPQLIRHAPQQPQVKQRNQLQHYAQASDQKQPHAIDERNAHQAQHNFQPQQQQQHERSVPSGTKPTMKQALSSSHSTATDAASPSPSSPQVQHVSTASALPVAPPVYFYNPAYVQATPPEQHPVSPYAIPVQFGAAQHAAAVVKLPSPSALFAPQTVLAPPYHSVQPLQSPLNGPASLVAAISPQNVILTKAPLQQPAVYMTQQNAVNSIGPSWSGAGLPYFIHPAGVHYGTHLYNPGTPLVISKRLESEVNVVADKQQSRQHLRPEQDRKLPQQQLGPPVTSGGNSDNNAIVKYP